MQAKEQREGTLYEFGRFRADSAQRALLRDGELVPLAPKTIDTLLALLESAGRVVEKDELLSKVWSETFVEDGSLTQNISILRKTLGDGVDGQRYIETIPKRGYRFIAPVKVVEAMAVAESGADSALPKQHLPKHRWLGRYWFVAAAATIVLAAAFVWAARTRPKPLTDQDVLVLADFANSTGDSVFEDTLREALAFQLEQSPFLKVLDDETMRQDLQLMRRPHEERITRQLAHDICVREAEKAMLSGSIASLGKSYAIELKATNCQTGATLAREEADATDKEHVLQALAKAAQGMRAKLGESLASIQKLAPPDFRVTTNSLEAFKAYAEGQALFTQSRFVESVPYFERATELDPNLALAWSWLASAVLNTGGGGDQARFREYWDRAYALRDQVSERERLWLTVNGSYQGHQEKAAEADELWARTYPRDPLPWMGLGTFHADRGEFEQSLDANLRAFELAPRRGLEAGSLIQAYIRLDRFAEAKQIAARHFARGLNDVQVHQLLLQIAWAQGDRDSAAKQIEWFAGKPEESRVVEDQAAHARMLGQLRHSRELLLRAAELARQRNLAGVAARLQAPNPNGDALLGSCAAAQKIGASSPTALALCGNGAMVERAEKNAAETSRSYPDSTLWKGARLPLIQAAIAFSRGEAAAAVDVLRSMQFERAYPFATYLRGLSYLRLKKGNEAAAEFQKIVSHKGADWGPMYPLSYVGLARGAALAGDRVRARKAYEEFFTLWKDADEDVPILAQARKEYAALELATDATRISHR